jgi:hypothetical protein
MQKPSTLPASVLDMIAFARFYVERLHETQDVVDLYPAVLATVHVVDWFVEGTLHRSLHGERKALEELFPAWVALKDFANGLKHAVREGKEPVSPTRRLQAKPEATEWEDLDAWAHLGKPDQPVWRIEHQGQMRSIYSLCRAFLHDFQAWVTPQLPPTSLAD